MARLKEDDLGRPSPQYLNEPGTDYEYWKGSNGHGNVRADDGQIFSIGTTTDAESVSGVGSVIGILKRLRTILTSVFNTDGNYIKVRGKQAVTITTHNSISIRDTGNYNSGDIWIDHIPGKKCLRVLNFLNQVINLRIFVYGENDMVGVVQSTTVPGNSAVLRTSQDLPWLDEPIMRVEVQVQPDEAPTSGSLTVQLLGVVE